MEKLARTDLWSLEEYAERRQAFRSEVMAHKKCRRLHLGPHATLYFEDRVTIKYQIQEMLRAERIFEAAGIEEELAAYNPLIPDGSNWKATFMLEYADVDERSRALAQLIGIEVTVWMQVKGFERVQPVADEDMDRTTSEKTSAVHFLRFELTSGMRDAIEAGESVAAGIDHAVYQYRTDEVSEYLRVALAGDLD